MKTDGAAVQSAGSAHLADTVLFYLAALSPVAMKLAGGLSVLAIAVYLLAWVTAMVLPKETRHGLPWSALTLLFLVYGTARVMLSDSLARGVASSASHLLLFLMATRLFTRESKGAAYQLLLLTMAGMVATAGLTDELLVGAAFILYLPAAMLALMLMQFTVDKPGRKPEQKKKILRDCSYLSFAATIFSVVGAALLFLAVPRVGMGMFFTGRGLGASMSGFGDRMRIGDMGDASRSKRVVLRVEFPERQGPPPPRLLYMKGAAFSMLVGDEWRLAHKGTKRLRPSPGGRKYRLFEPGPKPLLLKQEVSIVTRLDVIPAADRALELEFPDRDAQQELHMLFMDSEGSVRPWRAGRSTLTYTALSDITPPTREVLAGRGRSYPDYIQRTYAGSAWIPKKVCRLARKIAGDIEEPYDAAVSLVGYLKTGYSYSLKGTGKGRHGGELERFLFESRKGHCEHFATALTTMLKCLGIPARVATGFVSGEWNELGSYLVFTESDAHAWTEVYFPGYGWARFDATPAAYGRRSTPVVTGLYDMLRRLWYKHVVEYDLGVQLSFLRKLVPYLESGPMSTRSGRQDGWSGTGDYIGFLLVVISVLSLVFLYKFVPRWRARAKATPSPASLLFRELELAVAEAGLHRKGSETAAAFGGKAGSRFQDLEETARKICALHQMEVYAGVVPGSDELEQARARLREWHRSHKKRRPGWFSRKRERARKDRG